MEMLNFATWEKKGAKNRYETFAQHIDGFDALAHGGLLERGYYRHALPSLWQGDGGYGDWLLRET